MIKYIGWVILGTYVFYLLSVLFPFLLIVATFLAWMVPFLMWTGLDRSNRNQAIVLASLGIIGILFSSRHGIFLGWKQVFAINLPLLAMFVAVSFLSLTSSGVEDQELPKGKRAVITTAFGTHLLAAAINLSVLFVFGDRLQKKGRLSGNQMIILARSFCAAAWWSPFFVATGVALTYAPGMLWKKTIVPGIIMSIIAIGYSIFEVCFFRKSEFYGYPLKADSLTVPLFLASAVICTHHFQPEISILLLICLISPAGSLVFMKERPRIVTLYNFINKKLVSVTSQFIMFLAAGLFSIGVKSITHVYPEIFHFTGSAFTATLFAIVLGSMILIGIIGVHPIISIAIVSPLLLPLNPDPSQLGFLFVTSWAVSTGSSPLSGVGLAMVCRYKASPRIIISDNFLYAIIMWAISCGANFLFFN